MKNVIVSSNPPSVIVQQENVLIQVTPSTQVFSATFIPFAITATQGQTAFVLNSPPVFVVYLSINGLIKSHGSFSVAGSTLTLNTGLNAGDTVEGVYV